MCFHEDIEILCYNQDTKEEYYKKIKNIKKGEYVKSHGTEKKYSKVIYVGCIYSVNNYKFLDSHKGWQKHFYENKIYKDIKLTGGHSVLKKVLNEREKKQIIIDYYDRINYNEEKRKIDGLIRCPVVFLKDEYQVYQSNNKINKIYLLSIESSNPDLSYGLYSKHDILFESCGETYTKNSIGENKFNKD